MTGPVPTNGEDGLSLFITIPHPPVLRRGDRLEVEVRCISSPADGALLALELQAHRVIRARRAATCSSPVHDRILDILREHGPMTDHQIRRAWGWGCQDPPPASAAGMRTRRAELVQAGLVEREGTELMTTGSRRAAVWRVNRDAVGWTEGTDPKGVNR